MMRLKHFNDVPLGTVGNMRIDNHEVVYGVKKVSETRFERSNRAGEFDPSRMQFFVDDGERRIQKRLRALPRLEKFYLNEDDLEWYVKTDQESVHVDLQSKLYFLLICKDSHYYMASPETIVWVKATQFKDLRAGETFKWNGGVWYRIEGNHKVNAVSNDFKHTNIFSDDFVVDKA
jgi:hypothetical protein